MPPLEVNWNWFIGLGVILAVWAVVFVVVRLWVGRLRKWGVANDDTIMLTFVGQCDSWIRSIAPTSLLTILVIWAGVFLVNGGISAYAPGQNAGDLRDEVTPGQLYTGDNNPDTRTDELREESDELQDDRVDKLDDFREDFFNKRKETQEDEKAN